MDRSGKLVTKSLSRRDASTGYTVAVHFFDNDSFNAVWLDEEEDAKKAASYFAKHGDLGEYAAGQSVHYQCSVKKITGSYSESLVDQNSFSSFAP